MDKRNVAVWVLYDFGNSVTEVVFYLYFSQWLVIDRGVPDLYFNLIFVVSTALLLLSAPALAVMSDTFGRRMPFLRPTTKLMFLSFGLSGLVCVLWPQLTLLAALFFLAANFCYQLSFVFYNPMLEELATSEKRGLISGIGQAGNWIGQIVGLVVTLPLVDGSLTLFGEPGRAQALVPATILGALFAVPMLLQFREPASQAPLPAYGVSWKTSIRNLRPLFLVPGVAAFMIGYFLFNDAILTATDNFPIFLEQVWQVSDGTKSLLLIGILLTSAVGSLLAGWISDRVGLRKSLLWLIGAWAVCLPIVGFARPFSVFVASTVVMGLLFGAVWTVSRTVIIGLLPRDKLNYGMSFYTLAERFSTFVGPLAWGGIVTGLLPLGPLRYSIAMCAMGIFVVIGTFVLLWVPNSPHPQPFSADAEKGALLH